MKIKKGSSISHGIHHHQHHESCSRREFLTRLGLVTAGSAFMLNSTPVQALQSSSLFRKLANLETDRVLVLVQLNGGNDGLNTVVPFENDLYYNARPGISIAKNEAFKLNDTLGLNPSMSVLDSLWGEGNMGIIQNVGYPDPNLSHFRSTDIWLTSSDSDEVLGTGWAGRYFENQYPEFEQNPTDYPLAVQIGGSSSLLFQGSESGMGMNIANIDLLEQIVQEGIIYETAGLPDTLYGAEMEYVRDVANASYRYSDSIQSSYNASSNAVQFGAGQLSRSLSVVSRLIKGNLGSRIYLVSLGGFDTHAFQGNTHNALLNELSQAVSNFYDDLAADTRSEEVMIMTFSEFGRRVEQNGSQGTDHGTSAPLFVFGDGVEGGIFGSDPDLANVDEYGNLQYETDFRQIYTTLLENWFGLSPAETESAIGGSYTKVPFISDSMSVSNEDSGTPVKFRLAQNYPNPFNPVTTISFSLPAASQVRLQIFDIQGRLVSQLIDRRLNAGEHRVSFDAGTLASGTYLYRIDAGRFSRTKKMTLIK
ncbi:DUF1501 domain-containing protein [Balneola sp. MJW-20]|uniref:DUF1501 domain-containing protein n=1 Tax=Gracilimonas aurantiaca TaxID=3234185 RepID=UPI0034668BD4